MYLVRNCRMVQPCSFALTHLVESCYNRNWHKLVPVHLGHCTTGHELLMTGRLNTNQTSGRSGHFAPHNPIEHAIFSPSLLSHNFSLSFPIGLDGNFALYPLWVLGENGSYHWILPQPDQFEYIDPRPGGPEVTHTHTHAPLLSFSVLFYTQLYIFDSPLKTLCHIRTIH